MDGFAMTFQRRKQKGRSDSGTFFTIPHAIMDSPNWRALPVRAIKLTLDLGRQYRGNNNGDLCAAWKIMRARGWKSRSTLDGAITDALRFGMIEKTRQGGLHLCSLFALTWLAIDECGGKLDVPTTRVASGLWKHPPIPAKKKKNASTESVSIKHGIRVNSPKAA